jgi:hypothetical protein
MLVLGALPVRCTTVQQATFNKRIYLNACRSQLDVKATLPSRSMQLRSARATYQGVTSQARCAVTSTNISHGAAMVDGGAELSSLSLLSLDAS